MGGPLHIREAKLSSAMQIDGKEFIDKRFVV